MQTPYVPHVFGEAVQQKLRSRIGWLTAAVASSIPWPKKDVWIRYAGDDFILRGTENGDQPTAPAITIPSDRGEIEDSLAKVYRLCSVLGWFRDGYVDVVDTVQGSHAMGFGAQTRQAFTTVGQSGDTGFNCNYMPVIEDETVRIALAFWREGQRLTRVHDSYAFLSYFKVIESQFQRAEDRVDWFNRNIDLVGERAAARAADIRATEADVGRHLYDSGRNAVAHATLGRGIVDPDVPSDRRRISADLVLMRDLARRFIENDLQVPTARYVYAKRDRLTPWNSLIDADALAALREGGTPQTSLGLDGQQVTVCLWPDGPVPGLEQMTMHVDAVHEGAVQLVLFNARRTIMLVFVLDYRHGHAHTQLDAGGFVRLEGGYEPDEDDVRAYATFFHEVIGNALAELRIEGRDPVDCEIVIPVNIIPRIPAEAVEEAVSAFRRQHGA